MATLWYSHFDSTPEDRRLLLAEDWAKYIRNFLGDGIKNGGTNLQITADGSGFYTYLSPGYANIQGYFFRCEEDFESVRYKIDHATANNANARIDRIVLRLDRTIQARTILPTVILGEPGTNQPPELTRNSNIWEISLAQVRVPAGAVVIRPENITDERLDSSVCGIIDSLISADTENLFKTFYDAIQGAEKSLLELHEQLMDKLTEINTENLQTLKTQVDEATEKLDDYVGSIKTDITLLKQPVDFDNLAVFPGTTKLTDTTYNNTGNIYEVIKKNINDNYVGERLTVFEDSGAIVQRTKIYDELAEVILTDTTIRTTFSADGIIKEEVLDSDLIRQDQKFAMPSDEIEI